VGSIRCQGGYARELHYSTKLCQWTSSDFLVVGAYLRGRTWDLRTGEPDERPEDLENIRNVPLPDADPVFGYEGLLPKHWKG
jgi:uncharacterized protein YjlB